MYSGHGHLGESEGFPEQRETPSPSSLSERCNRSQVIWAWLSGFKDDLILNVGLANDGHSEIQSDASFCKYNFIYAVMLIGLHIVSGCFQITREEMSSCNRHCMAWKT